MLRAVKMSSFLRKMTNSMEAYIPLTKKNLALSGIVEKGEVPLKDLPTLP